MNTRLTFIFTLAILASTFSTAQADRVDSLVRIIQTDSSYKVRLQAVITLGKLQSRRAIPGFLSALKDENPYVRGMAASSLAQLGDPSVLAALRKIKDSDPHEFVRSQVTKAIQTLEQAQAGFSPGTRFYIRVGKMKNLASVGGDDMSRIFGNSIIRAFNNTREVSSTWSTTPGPDSKQLKKQKVLGYTLDGSIVKLTRRRQGNSYSISCDIKVSLSTFPGNSMKAFFTGGASTEVPVKAYRPEFETDLFREVLQGAAEGAKEDLYQNFLSRQ